ncbi:MAG: VOC family protein, partial [Actinobacteria bacterium]|nr:VOC family protein [Actinomycetota bacterium]
MPERRHRTAADRDRKRGGSTEVLPLLRKIDAVTIPVPDLDAGLSFYRDRLGHELLWRNDATGQAGLRLPGSDSEIVLTTR